MCRWRTMFSISTIASSTSTPVTRVIPSKVTRLSENPSIDIAQNVGIAESGKAIPAIRSDLDDRIVDQYAGHEGNSEQGNQIERKSQHRHRPERRDRRERQSDSGDQGRPDVARKKQHPKDGQSR